MGKVNRVTLESHYQNAGDIYQDTNTESAIEVVVAQVDANDDEMIAHRAKVVDPSSVDATKDKHVANNDLKTLQDQINAKGTDLTTHKSSSDHDGRYYTEAEIDAKITTINTRNTADEGALATHKTSSDHDGRYYTESEMDTKLGTKSDKVTSYLKTEVDTLLASNKSGDHTGTWQGLTPGEASEPINGARLDVVEAQFTKDQTQTSQIQRALSSILTDQSTPLWMVRLLGRTLVNHAGKQGGFHSQGQWDANLTIDTTTYKYGISSGKIDNSAGTTEKVSVNSQKMYLAGKYILLGFWAKSASGTPEVDVSCQSYDSTDSRTLNDKNIRKTIDSTWKFYYAKFDLTALTDNHWKLRVDTNTFGTANDVVNFDGMVVMELSSAEYSRVHTQTEIESEYGYVDSMQPTLNPWVKSFGKNLLPPFSQWTLHAESTLVNSYEFTLEATGGFKNNTIKVSVLRSQTYTLSIPNLPSNTTMRVGKDDGTTLGVYVIATTTNSVTFTTDSTTDIIVIAFYNEIAGTFTFTNPALVLGSVALDPFEPQNTDVAVIEGQFRGNPITGVYDSVTERDGHYWWNRRFEYKVLDGSFPWAYSADYTGYKRVRVAMSGGINFAQQVVKYDGKILINASGAWSGADRAQIESAGDLYIAIADTDTGWFDAWTGTEITEAWMDAYFNGWKYTGTSDKLTLSWVSVYDGASAPTQTLAYVSANRASGMTDENAYQLEYQLADSIEIDLGVVGGVSLFDGNNTVEFGEGMIPRELANPSYISSGDYYLINEEGSSNELDYRLEEVIGVHIGTTDFYQYTLQTTNPHGKYRIRIEGSDYDGIEPIYVTYIVLDKYKLSSNVIDVEVGYATNLRSVVQRNTQDIADGKNNVKDIEGDIERRLLKGEGESVQHGKESVSLSASFSGTKVVTFDRAYTDLPNVVATSTNSNYFAIVKSITATGFTIGITQKDGTSVTTTIDANWIAIGK
jgi:hypothetical protein